MAGAGAWVFFITFIAACAIMALAQEPGCRRATCGPGDDCNKKKCNDVNGTCIQEENCKNITICPGGCIRGKGKWCKFYKKCKCCMPDVCKPECNIDNGVCMFGNCTCDPGWCGPTCNESCCKPDCQNGGTCVGINECDCPEGFTGSTCEIPPVVCSNGRKCSNVNGTCYYKTNPILQNREACPNTNGGKKYCNPRGDCICCY